jgi:DNA polymerase-3 subunit gamma/tau
MNRVPRGFLASGLHGSGKTTLARLYAAALNCDNFPTTGDVCGTCSSCLNVQNGSHMSIIEIDAASNNGVDDIRELEDILAKKVINKYRVIILDEAHMLSKQAQAALLKTLEDAPKNNVFFLVTTDPEKLEGTIRSRCLSMPLRPLRPVDVGHSIRSILDAEGLAYDDAFVHSLSLWGGGSLRDVQQLLEQIVILAGTEPLNVSLLEESVGVISQEKYQELASVFINKSLRYAIDQVEAWYDDGVDLELMFMVGVPNLMRDFMMYLAGALSENVTLYSGISHEALARNLFLTADEVRNVNSAWEVYYPMMKTGTQTKVMFEVFFSKVCF